MIFSIVWIVNTWYVCWMVFSFRFFIEEYRFRSDTTALVKLEGVDTAEKKLVCLRMWKFIFQRNM